MSTWSYGAVIIIAALEAVLSFVVSGWQEARGKFPARDTIKLVCAWAFVAAFWFVVFLAWYDLLPYIRSEINSALNPDLHGGGTSNEQRKG